MDDERQHSFNLRLTHFQVTNTLSTQTSPLLIGFDSLSFTPQNANCYAEYLNLQDCYFSRDRLPGLKVLLVKVCVGLAIGLNLEQLVIVSQHLLVWTVCCQRTSHLGATQDHLMYEQQVIFSKHSFFFFLLLQRGTSISKSTHF